MYGVRASRGDGTSRQKTVRVTPCEVRDGRDESDEEDEGDGGDRSDMCDGVV